jgi:CheY-like chemotaxis protein/HPt (histidine-containing phosphotransfer) domain-containing protein
LNNLIGNAIKFTAQGEIVVSLTLNQRTDARTGIRFEVKDTGIGLSEAEIPRIFRSFSQADSSTTRRYGGTGLGLAIAKQLTEIMGGDMGVVSKPGVGSTFWLALPLEVVDDAPVIAPDQSLAGRRLLIVDDNATARAACARLCESWGIEPSGATTGAQALELLHAAAHRGQPFDSILLDQDMPGMKGTLLARLIVAAPELEHTPIILMLAHSDADELAMQAGISQSLIKPLRSRVLQAALRDALSSAPGAQPAQRTAIPLRGRVLLVEDNPVNREVARTFIEGFGCVVETAGDGIAALRAVRRTEYDLIFMDCLMPEMDGLEATRQLRMLEGERARRIPVVALTADTTAEGQAACRAAGMDDYLSKPIDPIRLRRCLARWLGQPDAAGEAAEAEPEPASPELENRLPEEPVLLDEAPLRALRMMRQPNKPDLVAKVVSMYLERTPILLADLNAAMAARDASAVRSLAHALKSSSAHIGAGALSTLARELEDSSKAVPFEVGSAGAIVEKMTQTYALVDEGLRHMRHE